MWPQLRIVLDTNVLVSAMLSPSSASGIALRIGVALCTLMASEATLNEAEDVFLRPKFDRYISPQSRVKFLEDYREALEIVPALSRVEACRDSRDDKFLELAVDGKADLIVTGDEDLLSMHSFGGIRILNPHQFLALLNEVPAAM